MKIASAIAIYIYFCVTIQSEVLVKPRSEIFFGKKAELEITGIPQVANPYDPEIISVDATIKFKSTRSIIIPAFWYQPYKSILTNGQEQLFKNGEAHWRLRFIPIEAGEFSISISIVLNKINYSDLIITNFYASNQSVDQKNLSTVDFLKICKVSENNQYFETIGKTPILLIGECVCWPGNKGTFDYRQWFPAMRESGQNYARLWMCPWAFGIETDTRSLTNYSLDRAWQLDQVMELAAQNGIYILLCLEYHGMFEETPDYWGGNNYWPKNPYNKAVGGPCINQNDFFKNVIAKDIFKKRLRYLVARYSAFWNLLAWQFFNEIDNVYKYLNPTDVASWHKEMAEWLKTHDPYNHMVTTSLTSGSDRPEIWSITNIDFSVYHAYNHTQPVSKISKIIDSFIKKYKKPVMIGEYGTDWRGWNRSQDPYLRGLRQGILTGAISGSVGTSMSWWWEKLFEENVYPYFRITSQILNATRLSFDKATPIIFPYSNSAPAELGTLLTDKKPFSVTLTLNQEWGTKLPGILAISTPEIAEFSSSVFNSFVHNSAHPDLKIPFEIKAFFDTNAQITLHLNSVSTDPILCIDLDGTNIFKLPLKNIDGTYQVNNEYNTNITVAIPQGFHKINIINRGVDWFFLDWVQISNILPTTLPTNWTPQPAACGVTLPNSSIIYVVSPFTHYPAGASNQNPITLSNAYLLTTNWLPPESIVHWYNPTDGSYQGTSKTIVSSNNTLITLPSFNDDLIGFIYPQYRMSPPKSLYNSLIQLEVSPAGPMIYSILSSTNLRDWQKKYISILSNNNIIFTTNMTSDYEFFKSQIEPITNGLQFK